MNETSPILDVKGLTVGYSGVPVLEDVNLAARDGEVIGIVGGNGSGKSTFLRTLAGLQREIRGDVLVNGRGILHLSTSARVRECKIGYLPQHSRSIPNLTVRENLHLAQWNVSSWSEREKVITKILARSPFDQLRGHMKEYADVLSGGQELLLALVILSLQNHEILLLDEPSDGLDDFNRTKLINLIGELKKTSRTIIVIEQLLRVLFCFSDRVFIVMRKPEPGIGQTDLPNLGVMTLVEMAQESVNTIRDIYVNNSVLSPEQTKMIDLLIQQKSHLRGRMTIPADPIALTDPSATPLG